MLPDNPFLKLFIIVVFICAFTSGVWTMFETGEFAWPNWPGIFCVTEPGVEPITPEEAATAAEAEYGIPASLLLLIYQIEESPALSTPNDPFNPTFVDLTTKTELTQVWNQKEK